MKKIISIVIVTAILMIGGYSLFKKTSGKPVVGESPDEFIEYTANEFLFSYPTNWFIEDRWVSSGIPYLRVSNYDPDVLSTSQNPYGNYFKIEFWKTSNEKNLSLESWIDDFMQNSESAPILLSKNPITVGGIEGIIQDEGARAGQSQHP